MDRENEAIELETSNGDLPPDVDESRDEIEAEGLGSQNRLRIPVVPLRGTVVFPSVAAPIAAGREKTLKGIEAALDGDKYVFAVAQRDAELEDPVPEALNRVGTICRIAQMQRVPGGVQMVINTPLGQRSRFDESAIRREARALDIPCITTVAGAGAAVDGIRAVRGGAGQVVSLQDLPDS